MDGASGQVAGQLNMGMDNICYLVHCNNTRQVVVIGNNNEDLGLAVLKANANTI